MDKKSVSRPDEKHRAEIEAGDKHHSQRSLGVMTRRELESEVVASRKRLAESQLSANPNWGPEVDRLLAESDKLKNQLAQRSVRLAEAEALLCDIDACLRGTARQNYPGNLNREDMLRLAQKLPALQQDLADALSQRDAARRELAEAKKYGGEMAKAFHEAAYEDD